ncbi:MAG: glycosyltransferase [Streptomycetaceae bacterium]|nr:glycosyltransferase [Streptomycetaceae bacterium]
MLSVYEGFFSGGARILHSDVVAGLQEGGQYHRVLSIHGEMYREATRQKIEDDACYRSLTAAGVPVTALRAGAPQTSADGLGAFTPAELAATARLTADADVILSLKEQPLELLNQPGLPLRPIIACLHRSDPENQGPGLQHLRAAVADGRVAAAICCAESTRTAYQAAGIPAEVLHTIPNGVDLLRFRPDPRRRELMRASLGIPADATVVIFAARYAAMKNVPLFLRAAQAFLRREPRGHIIMCGAGMTPANPELRRDIAAAFIDEPQYASDIPEQAEWATAAKQGRPRSAGAGGEASRRTLADRLSLLGVRGDMEALYAAADVVSLTSSHGEAAPLCLIEGMMCGAVPVATDIGDSASIVAGHGILTPADGETIGDAWLEAAGRRNEFGPALLHSRERFSRTRMIASYSALIDRLHHKTGRASLPDPL